MSKNKIKKENAITLIALVVTIIFRYDELIKFSNNNSFLPITNLSFYNIPIDVDTIKKTAKKMLTLNLPIEQIIEITELSKEEIEKIKNSK